MPDVWRSMRPPLVVSLVTTYDDYGRANASPKTWWTPISYDPPMMVMALKPQSDTAMNIKETTVWVLHLPSRYVAEKVLHTAKALPRGECELDDVGMKWFWMEDSRLRRPVPVVEGMPFIIFQGLATGACGDHTLFWGSAEIWGGFGEEGVEEVVLHRGRNVFVELGAEFETEPY